MPRARLVRRATEVLPDWQYALPMRLAHGVAAWVAYAVAIRVCGCRWHYLGDRGRSPYQRNIIPTGREEVVGRVREYGSGVWMLRALSVRRARRSFRTGTTHYPRGWRTKRAPLAIHESRVWAGIPPSPRTLSPA
jgi:hypothetical protein